MDRNPRLAQLLQLLPSIYAVQPRGSAVGELLGTLADALHKLDGDSERVLRDQWIALADGHAETAVEEQESTLQSGQEVSTPLELLGNSLDIRMEPWETGKSEVYRRRLRKTAALLTRGLTTPRSVLALAALSLGAELCPSLLRRGDTTTGWGIDPRHASKCASCGMAANGECPSTQHRLLEAVLTDNPVSSKRLRFGPLLPEDTFAVKNQSLCTDLPVITLTAVDETAIYPAVQNRATKEVVLYAGELAAGETLTIRPSVEFLELGPFASGDTTGHHPWQLLQPSGAATVAGPQGVKNVSQQVYYMRGYAFGEAAFATRDENEEEPRFAALQRSIRTPQVRPGEDEWAFRLFTGFDIEVVAGAGLTPDIVDEAPATPTGGGAEISLDWWTRPPATFRLRIPKTEAVRSAEAMGALDLLRRSVETARAAGVRALVDIPEPPWTESHVFHLILKTHTATTWTEEAEVGEGRFSAVIDAAFQEDVESADILGIRGIFDLTRFGWTRLAPGFQEDAGAQDELGIQGVFDRTRFGWTRPSPGFQEDASARDELGIQGVFNRTRFGWTRPSPGFQEDASARDELGIQGTLDRTRFGWTRFAPDLEEDDSA